MGRALIRSPDGKVCGPGIEIHGKLDCPEERGRELDLVNQHQPVVVHETGGVIKG